VKKFLALVVTLFVALSMVSGCGGDKKAELLKGLTTEISTLIGNVDKLAGAAELKGEDAKKATEGLKGIMDKIGKLKEAAKGNANAEKDLAGLLEKATNISEKVSRGIAAGNLNVDLKALDPANLEKDGWVALKDAAGKITGYYNPKTMVKDDLGKKAFAWIAKVGEDGKVNGFSNVAFDYAAGKIALSKDLALESKDGVLSLVDKAKDALKSLNWGTGLDLKGIDLNSVFEKIKPEGWDMKKLAAAVTGNTANAPASVDKVALAKDVISFTEKNEVTLKNLADSINSGKIDKSALLDLGSKALNAVKDNNKSLTAKYGDFLKPIANVLQMQEDRIQAMIDGVNGNTARFKEGHDMKVKVLELLSKFKKDNNL